METLLYLAEWNAKTSANANRCLIHMDNTLKWSYAWGHSQESHLGEKYAAKKGVVKVCIWWKN